jgi:hypothetical protein
MGVPKRLLDRVEFLFTIRLYSGEPFYSSQFSTRGLDSEYETRAYWKTIKENGTGAANTLLTTNMGSG